MNKQWLQVFIAALFEVMWVIGLKHAHDVWSWLGTAIAICISFYLMIGASSKLPVGTVYAIFVGLGTAGTVLAEILLFAEPFKFAKLVLILILLGGVAGLKMVTPNQPETKGSESI